MEIFFRVKGDVVVALGGDFNTFDIMDLSARTGLLPLVTDPIHEAKARSTCLRPPNRACIPQKSYHLPSEKTTKQLLQ